MKNINFFNSLFSKNYKAYLIFVGLTFVLWFTIQLVKSYSYQTNLNINLINIPNNIAIDTLTKPIKIKLKTNGLRLWTYNLSDRQIEIDFDEAQIDSSKVKLNTNLLKTGIRKRFGLNEDNIEIYKSSLIYTYRKKATKKVPVKASINLKYSTGYNSTHPIQLSPDSVTLSGPINQLNKIKFITNEKLTIEKVKDTISGILKLKVPNENIKPLQPEVEFFMPVEKYSEKTLMVDIETINVPDSLELTTYPSQVRISFSVSLKSYDKISELDFKVVCDYIERYEDKAVMIPKLVKVPQQIINLKMHNKKVDYLIKQKQ